MSGSEPRLGGFTGRTHTLVICDETLTPVPPDKVAWVRASWEGEIAYGDGWSSHSNPYPRFEPGPPIARLYAGWLLGWLLAEERRAGREGWGVCGCRREHK